MIISKKEFEDLPDKHLIILRDRNPLDLKDIMGEFDKMLNNQPIDQKTVDRAQQFHNELSEVLDRIQQRLNIRTSNAINFAKEISQCKLKKVTT